MRILFIGQAPFGAESLETLVSQGENIVGVITIADVPQQKYVNPVKACAEKHKIPLYQSNYLKNNEAISWAKKLSPDLLVLAFVTSFVPKEMIDCAPLGGINYHPSLLPKYRGGSAINRAVINGEKETGVTIHFIDEGIDTGPILLQEKVAIDPDDTVKSVYFNKLYPLGIKMIVEAVTTIKNGAANPAIQDESQASFQPVITAEDTRINWLRSVSELYNLIRGANPAPGAYTSMKDEPCKLFDAYRSDGSGTAGAVVSIDDDSVGIAAHGGIINVKVFQPAGGKKISAAEFVEKFNLHIGDTFK